MKAKVVVILLLSSAPLLAQQRQTSQDEYTLYELLAPETASFKIDYEVTATTPGAACAAAVSMPPMRALACGERTKYACVWWGRLMSST